MSTTKKVLSFCTGCFRKVHKNPDCLRDYCPKRQGKFKNKTGSVHSYYQSKDWRGNPSKKLGQRGGLREAQLKRKPNCEECEKEGFINPATVVDHIKDWKLGKTEQERKELFENPSNHQSLCSSDHNRKTGRNN